jgi:hypothetical protein
MQRSTNAHEGVEGCTASWDMFCETQKELPDLDVLRWTDDVREHIWRTGARANLPTGWLSGAVGGGAFAVLEPPAAASPWVPQLLQQARAFRQKLDAADRLQEADRRQVRVLPTSCPVLASSPQEGLHLASLVVDAMARACLQQLDDVALDSCMVCLRAHAACGGCHALAAVR